jgi:hypothetical protein
MPKVERKVPPDQTEHQAFLMLGWIVFIIIPSIIVWILYRGFHFRIPQIIWLLGVTILPLMYAYAVIRYWLRLPGLLAKQWPKPRLLVSRKFDERCMAEADKNQDALVGYEHDKTPVYWSEKQRSMQTNLPGMTGAGKTTLLLNLVEQDIRRGHPVVYFDGKGDKELVIRIMDMAFASGRGSDIRIIDPTHPELSAKFNPFYTKDGDIQQKVGAVADSLSVSVVKEDFFAENQRAFLLAITTVLEHSRKLFTFLDVLIACQSPDVVERLIAENRNRVMSDPDISMDKKTSYRLAIDTLHTNYQDKEWLTKIRGLLNQLLPFATGNIGQITCACDHLLTFEAVAEQKLILVVSMNLGMDSHPVKALGRMLMRNLQFMVATRYNHYLMNQKHPFISIILDEFGLYAYQGFKDIIHTARQANACFIFSFQSIEQLAMDVGESFAKDMASAPNTNFMMKIRNEDTARGFLLASASVPTEKISYRVEKGTVLDSADYVEEGTGTRQEVFETRVQDRQIKLLPVGQMMALLPDPKVGVLVKHIHVRRGIESRLGKVPAWLQPLKNPKEDDISLGLHLDGGIPPDNGEGGKTRRKKQNANLQSPENFGAVFDRTSGARPAGSGTANS